MARETKILCWNANGLASRRQELATLAGDEDIDLLLVTETHLRPGQRFSLPGYHVYRTDRPANPDPALRRHVRGGTAILVHRRMTHRHVPLQMAALEATCVATLIGGRETHLTSVYSPPNAPFPRLDLDALLRIPGPTLIGGDLNAKHTSWHCRRSNVKGRQLFQMTEGRQEVSVVAPVSPTHYPTRGNPDVLDLVVHKDLPYTIEIAAIDDLSSDHLPVLVTLEATPMNRFPRRPTTVKTDWARFHSLLTNSLPPPSQARTPAELDAQVTHLHETITQGIEAASKTVTRRTARTALPPAIREAIEERRRLLRAWHRLRHPDTKRRLNAQTTLVKRLLDDHRTDSWTAYLESLDIADGSAWKAAKILRQPKTASHPLHGQRGLVYTPPDKAEAFADTMEEQFQLHPTLYDEATIRRVEGFAARYFNSAHQEEEEEEDGLQPFTVEEVAAIVSQAKPRKSPGLDRIGTRALLSSPPELLGILHMVFNSVLTLRHFPQPWKVAKIILLPKPGKSPLFPQNYRPISLLPVISKLFERLLLSRIGPILEGVIRPEQFGFRRGHSTTHQLTRVVTHLVDKANNNRCTAAVLLDVSKAFDRVWHDGLLKKLSMTPLPTAAVHLLRSYLTGRSFRISAEGHLSTPRPIAAGVPQGSVLGPVLYLVYANDIPVAPEVNLALYADDALFYSSSTQPGRATELMQHQLDMLTPWLRKWRISVNADKSEAIMFKKPRRMSRALPPPPSLDGVPLPWKKEVKYLGVHLDWRLSFTPHASAKVVEGKKIAGFLGPLLCPSSPVPLRAKRLMFLMIVRALVMYASPAWWALLCKTSRQKIEAVQSMALRRLTKSPWFVRNDVIREGLQVPSLDEYARASAARMFEKAAASPHEHIAALARREGAAELHRPRPIAILDDPP